VRFCVLSTGSKANATYVESGDSAVLIDNGLSAKKLEGRLHLAGLNSSKIKAILVTHEHGDHITGVASLSRKLKIPIYANRLTRRCLKDGYAFDVFNNGEKFNIGALEIKPFSIIHDAADPVGFVCGAEGLKFGSVTDLGRVTDTVREALRGVNSLLLESNHDQEMLASCSYTWELKQRISSSHGHLSNDASAALLQELIHGDLNHVILGHISENSNTPELALSTANRYLEYIKYSPTILCGSVYTPTPVFEVGVEGVSAPRFAIAV
jgi:phosphoribosyl 1,2-cyclic phosphodiesterase